MEKSRVSFLIALTKQLELVLHEEAWDTEVAGWVASLRSALEELLGFGGAHALDRSLEEDLDADDASDGRDDDGGDSEDADAYDDGSSRGELPRTMGTGRPGRNVPRGTPDRLTEQEVRRSRTPVMNLTQAQLDKAVKSARLEERAKARATSQPKSGARRGKKRPKK